MSGLIVHEWAEGAGGAEKVLDQMLAAFPKSDLRVLWNDAPERFVNARETWLARTPLRHHKALSIPFQLPTWRRLSEKESYSWMLVSSHLFAHHAKVASQPNLRKFVYAHTPARYIWEPNLDVRGASLPVRAASAVLRPIDRKRAQEAFLIAANSEFTRQRIQRTWDRDADVIFPPVDVERIIEMKDWRDALNGTESKMLESLPADFLLGASRMIPYKRLDAVIKAGEATQTPVVLAGDGPLWNTLSEQASRSTTHVTLCRRPSDAFLYALYQQCRAFVFPAVEDFGIMPIEAMAAGAPVIVPGTGGAAESIRMVDGGSTVEDFEPASWAAALTAADKIDRQSLPHRTRRFSNRSFQNSLRSWVGAENNQGNVEDER